MEDFKVAETKSSDPYYILGKTIKEHLSFTLTDLGMKALENRLGEIIADGFLDEIIKNQAEIVKKSRENLARELMDKTVRAEEREKRAESLEKKWKQKKVELESLEENLERLETLIAELKEVDVGGVTETDPFLSGAKKAYYFILGQTGDETKAAKAFNSYLLIGKTAEGAEPFVSPKTKAGEAYKKKYGLDPEWSHIAR